MGNAATAATAGQSALLKLEISGAVLTVGLNRPAKRNALNDGIMLAIQDCFSNLPEGIGAVVIHGIGERRCGTGYSTGFNTAACLSSRHCGAL